MAGFYAGFDGSGFPGLQAMQWLWDNTNLEWAGFYLAPAPSHRGTSWMPPGNQDGVRAALQEMGWGMAPLYLGQQAEGGPGSHVLTPAQGRADAAGAALLADRAGFEAGSLVFLDIEEGGILQPAMLEYYAAWVGGLRALGFKPGVYCSHAQAAGQLQARLPCEAAWVWNLAYFSCPLHGQHPFPEADPAFSGFPTAAAWQLMQDCAIQVGDRRVNADLNSSLYRDPSRME